jgi:translocation and assembly module TamA
MSFADALPLASAHATRSALGVAVCALLLCCALGVTRAWAQADAAPQADPADTDADTPEAARAEADDEEAQARPLLDPGVTTLEAGANHAYRLEVRAPAKLRALLVQHLDLARFREQPDIAPIEVARLVAAAPAQARSLLEPEGYFNAEVEVKRVDSADGRSPPTVTVRVVPGPLARVGRLQIEMQGPFAAAMEGGDAALRRRWERLQARWALPSGAPFTQAAWTAAKNSLLASLRSRGYAAASYTGTGAQVDAQTNRVRLFLVVDSGPLYRVGEIRVEGLERTPESAALNVVPFKTGEVYSEKMLLDYQEALQKTGLYEGVAVELDLDPERADHATVMAKLRELPLQSASPSIGYSTNVGPRVGLEYTHRRPFGRDVVFSTKLQIARDEESASLDLATYPDERGYRNLLSLSAGRLDAGGAPSDTQRVRVGRERTTERLDRLYYLEFNRTTVDTDTESSTSRALWGNYEWVRRDVNNVLFPTRGFIWRLQGGGGYAVDEEEDKGPFARVYLQGSWYQPLGGPWYSLLRAEGAEVFRKGGLQIPDSLLFRAGGDNSVRGYGYRTLGPERDGAVVGGVVMATGTAELMRRLSDRWRDWYLATFVDAGNAADDWREIDPVIGYGVGVRWRSPVGPLRMDLAYGQREQQLRLHLSVGVSF